MVSLTVGHLHIYMCACVCVLRVLRLELRATSMGPSSHRPPVHPMKGNYLGSMAGTEDGYLRSKVPLGTCRASSIPWYPDPLRSRRHLGLRVAGVNPKP